jgi:mRNA interferase RelE/StbE
VIDSLQVNPRPSGVVKLKGQEDKYRVRVDRYRILYIVRDEILTVTVVAVGHRRDVYRRSR